MICNFSIAFRFLTCFTLLMVVIFSQSAQAVGKISPVENSSVTRIAPQITENADLGIVVETDSWSYQIGEEVDVTVILTNSSENSITGSLDLSLRLIRPDSPVWIPVFTAEPRSFSVSAHSEVQETYKLTVAEYQDSGLFDIVVTSGEAVGSFGFIVGAGYDLTMQVPNSVDVGEEFDVILELKNLLSTAITNIAVDVLFPLDNSLDNPGKQLLIPSLAPGEAYQQTWSISVKEAGSNNLIAAATSENGGSRKFVVPISVLGESELIPIVQDAEAVPQGSSIIIKGDIHNIGGKTAEDVTAILDLPPGLSVSGNLTLDVGDIPGGQAKNVTWTVEADLDGMYAIELRARDRFGNEGADFGSVSVIAVAGTGLTFESRRKPQGSEVQIPLTSKEIREKVGNIDLTLSYDSSVLQAYEVIKGSLTQDSLIDSNIQDGTIKISLADSDGFTGDGSVAYIRYNVIGGEGSSSPLIIEEAPANDADYAVLDIPTNNGIFTVIGVEESLGDCDGDGEISVVDALCALQMAVGKKTEDLSMDINGDREVTSLDARLILKTAVGSGDVDIASDIPSDGDDEQPTAGTDQTKPPGERLLSAVPDREAAASLLNKLGSTGVNTQGVDIYVFPMLDSDESYVFFVFDSSEGFDFENVGGGIDSIEEFISLLAGLDESGEYGIRRVAIQLLGDNGEPLITLTAPTDIINAFAQGTISREQFMEELAVLMSPEFAEMAQEATE